MMFLYTISFFCEQVYAEVDPAVEAAKQQKDREQEEARWRRKNEENQKASTGVGQGEGVGSDQDEENERENETDFLGIFLFLKVNNLSRFWRVGGCCVVNLDNSRPSVSLGLSVSRWVSLPAPSFFLAITPSRCEHKS